MFSLGVVGEVLQDQRNTDRQHIAAILSETGVGVSFMQVTESDSAHACSMQVPNCHRYAPSTAIKVKWQNKNYVY
jgi:hypothetical protein